MSKERGESRMDNAMKYMNYISIAMLGIGALIGSSGLVAGAILDLGVINPGINALRKKKK